jgi:alkanesulfonate monooxygenase SsuD/methylene tetrahydromethanopterin reductase-like flavin-dependent oxidoreductase (luciferase family)
MRVGVSLRSAYVMDDVRTGARWMVERARAAREAGLDSLFIGDHHVTGIPYYQNSPTLGRLLAEWGDAPAGALYLLPLWHPVLVAEQIGTLASIAQGRFIMQCAIGGDRNQFAAMSAELRTRPSRFEAALDVIRRLLAGEMVTTTAPWPIERAKIGPVPPEPVEVWIGAAASPGIDRAARLGDGFLAGPESPPDGARQLATEYLERCEAHGRTPTAVAARRDIHVGADEADARRVAGPIVDGGYRGFPPDAPVVGRPEQVAETFRDLAAMGYTDVIVRHLAEDQAEVLKSFERLAEVRRLVADA